MEIISQQEEDYTNIAAWFCSIWIWSLCCPWPRVSWLWWRRNRLCPHDKQRAAIWIRSRDTYRSWSMRYWKWKCGFKQQENEHVTWYVRQFLQCKTHWQWLLKHDSPRSQSSVFVSTESLFCDGHNHLTVTFHMLRSWCYIQEYKDGSSP